MSLRSLRSADHYYHCHHCIIVIRIIVVIISMVIDVIVLIIIVVVTIIITNVIIIVIIIIIFGIVPNMLFATKNTRAKLKSHLWFLSVNYQPYQTISHLVLQHQLIIISRISG